MPFSCSPDIVSLWKELISEYVNGDLDTCKTKRTDCF